MKRVRLRCSVLVYLVYLPFHCFPTVSQLCSALRVVAFCSILFTSLSHAQSIPQLINYQGRLLSTEGDPAPTAEYSLSVSLFTADSGGSHVWREDHPSVPVVRGYFNLIIGGRSADGALASQITQGTRYIEVTAGAYSTGRQSMLSVPYALQASNSITLAGHDWSSILVSGNNPALAAIKGAKVEIQGITTSQIKDNDILSVDIQDFTIISADLAPAVSKALSPVGTIVAFGGDVSALEPKPGWLRCTGDPISRTTYADLYATIHDYFGNGDGATTFNLPDFMGLFLRGVDHGSGRDEEAAGRTQFRSGGGGGAYQPGSFQNDAFETHVHTYSVVNGAVGVFGGAATPNQGNGSWQNNTVHATGGVENRPKSIAVNYLIKY